jgi:hypothetical protein
LEDFLEEDFFVAEVFLLGTLPPAFLASDNPIAIACFLLVTFLPEPLLSVPFFFSCIAFSTLSDAFLPYLAIADAPPWNRFSYRTIISSLSPLLSSQNVSAKLRNASLRRFERAVTAPS